MLSPLLFLIYINDLFLSSKYLAFILFADNTNIFFFCHKDLPTLIKIVNQGFLLVSSWFHANKLTVHPDKSKLIFFINNIKQLISQDLTSLITSQYLKYRKTNF